MRKTDKVYLFIHLTDIYWAVLFVCFFTPEVCFYFTQTGKVSKQCPPSGRGHGLDRPPPWACWPCTQLAERVPPGQLGGGGKRKADMGPGVLQGTASPSPPTLSPQGLWARQAGRPERELWKQPTPKFWKVGAHPFKSRWNMCPHGLACWQYIHSLITRRNKWGRLYVRSGCVLQKTKNNTEWAELWQQGVWDGRESLFPPLQLSA